MKKFLFNIYRSALAFNSTEYFCLRIFIYSGLQIIK